MEDRDKMSFLSSELALSTLQSVEMQVRACQKFLELLEGDKEEARIQTQIYMKALFQPQSQPQSKKEL